MDKHRILLVCGLGRCGSSLVMQMLKAGGLAVPGFWPYFEQPKEHSDATREWMRSYQAIKYLNPGRAGKAPLPEEHSYRCLWLDRDPKEQARSWVKFAENRKPLEVPKHEAIAKTIGHLSTMRERGLLVVKNISAKPVPLLRFETILEKPDHVAKALEMMAGVDLDTKAMTAVVKPREPTCLEDMSLEEKSPPQRGLN